MASVALDSQAAVLPAGGGETSELSALVGGGAEPVDAGVVADRVVRGVHHDALVVLVGGVLGGPVGVEEGETADLLADALLGEGSEVGVGLQVVDTGDDRLTVGDTLGNSSLPATSSDSDSVDAEALLSPVAQSSGLIRPGGSLAPVDRRQLSELPRAHPQDELHRAGLLLLPELFEIFERTHV